MNSMGNKLIKLKTSTMKKYTLLFFIGFLFSCNAQKESSVDLSEITSGCPSDGSCEIKILKNKQLILLFDDLGGMYYDIQDNDGTTVIHYQYAKTTQAKIQDGHYREDIILEIKNSDKSLKLTDVALQKTKIIFGRHCFCKGQTGYFKIDKGTLVLTQKKEIIKLELVFSTEKVPQIIKHISATLH